MGMRSEEEYSEEDSSFDARDDEFADDNNDTDAPTEGACIRLDALL